MIGETTLDERVNNQLSRLEEVRKHYGHRFSSIRDGILADEDLVCQLIADATWLATYFGIDLDSMIDETVNDVRRRFPDIC